MKNSRPWLPLLPLLGFGAAVAAAGWFGARSSPRDFRNKLWYARLDKSPLHPPDSVFPIVWTALYALMAVSGYRAWLQPNSPARSRALCLWATQLATNAKWTYLFFGQHRPKLALVDIFALEAQIAGYILTAKEVDPAAAACFVPYAAWVAFAAFLNAEIVRRNPHAEHLVPHGSR